MGNAIRGLALLALPTLLHKVLSTFCKILSFERDALDMKSLHQFGHKLVFLVDWFQRENGLVR